jgi:hypothetical protein
MNDNKNTNTPAVRSNTGLATTNSGFLSSIESMEDLDQAVEYVASSKTYCERFKINTKDEATGEMKREVDRNAVAICLMLGREIGLNPFTSIAMGPGRLNEEAVIKVHRGRDLGLSPMNAMAQIYVFKSGNGTENVYTSIHVINKCLSENGVTRNIIENGNGVHYLYYDIKTKEPVLFDDDFCFLVTPASNPEDVAKAVKSGMKLVTRKPTKRALVELTRHYRDGRTETVAIPYTLQQAIDAGLYKGINSFGEEVKGKSNWNNHPETHLIKMSIMLGARIIIGDVLNGCYIPEELPDSITTVDVDATIVD